MMADYDAPIPNPGRYAIFKMDIDGAYPGLGPVESIQRMK